MRVYRGGVLVRKELSEGFDNRPTMFKYYDAAGNLLRLERDTDRDGVIDAWSYYEDGRIVRVGRDVNGDGTPDSIDFVD